MRKYQMITGSMTYSQYTPHGAHPIGCVHPYTTTPVDNVPMYGIIGVKGMVVVKLFGWLRKRDKVDDLDPATFSKLPPWAQQRNPKFEAKLELRRRQMDAMYGPMRRKR